MMRVISTTASAGCFFLVIIGFLFIVSADNDIMTVEANILMGGGENESEIRVEVPDYIFLGNVNPKGVSDEFKIYINNTGNVDIRVTPRLINHSEVIFSHLYFRKYLTSNGSAVPYTRIGDFSIDISKPSSGQEYRSNYFYMRLDLTEYGETINDNIMGHKTDVKFFAAEN